jgi:hypothetical protein
MEWVTDDWMRKIEEENRFDLCFIYLIVTGFSHNRNLFEKIGDYSRADRRLIALDTAWGELNGVHVTFAWGVVVLCVAHDV